MKITLVVLVLAALVLVALAATAGKKYDLKKKDSELFTEWLNDRPGKKNAIKSKDEKLKKYKIFQGNLKKIRELNAKGEAIFDLNDFSDIDPEEFKRTHSNTQPPTQEQAKRFIQETATAEEIAQLPAKKDWRSHSFKVVNGVVNQGSCGSCWAFSTAANIEGAWAVTHQKATWKMSEKQILDCTKNGASYYGCNGGWMGAAMDQLATSPSGGLRSPSYYGAYSPVRGTCKTVTSGPVAKLSGHIRIGTTHDAIRAALIKYGPLSVIVDADTWQSYRSGVFGSTCGTDATHAVTLVGYTTTSTGIPIWIVKNSWGTGWGVSGYAYVRRGSTSACGIHNWVLTAKIVPPPPANWVNYGGGFQTRAYSGSSAVFHSGLVTTGTAKWSTNIFIKSTGSAIAPTSGRKIFLAGVNANTIGRVDAYLWTNAAGVSYTNLSWHGGGAGTNWISLDQIVYSRSTSLTAAVLNHSWAAYGGGYEAASFTNDAGAVYVNGMIKHAAFPKGKPIFTLPVDSRPSYREVFATLAAGQVYARVDVLPTGEVVLVSTVPVSGWLSLANVHFRPAGTVFAAIAPANYWVAYPGYSGAAVSVGADGRAFLRGLVKGGKSNIIGTLPVNARPALKRLFAVACSTGVCRVDVGPTGTVTLIAKTYGQAGWPSWVSLSGISYDPTPDTAY